MSVEALEIGLASAPGPKIGDEVSRETFKLSLETSIIQHFSIWQVFKIKWLRFVEKHKIEFWGRKFSDLWLPPPNVRDGPLDRRASRGEFPQ